MKKTLIAIAFACVSSFAFAQDAGMTSKKGIPILPEASDWGLGFDASPFFKYVGNIFNGTIDQGSPSPGFTSDSPTMTLYGKKCVAANKFYRGRLRLGFGSQTWNFEVPDKPTFTDTVPNNEIFSSDARKRTAININLSLGFEMRRGKGRVQGYYGPEAWIGFGTSKITNNFHNRIDSTMTEGSPDITTYTSAADPAAPYGGYFPVTASGDRVTQIKNGTTFTIGVRGFAGIEYFFMAKASIGAEFGWGIGVTATGATETSEEYWEPTLNNNVGGIKTELHSNPGKSSSFGLDTDNAYGAINLFFYF